MEGKVGFLKFRFGVERRGVGGKMGGWGWGG